MFIGDKATILCGFDGANPRIIPESRLKSWTPPPKTLPRSPGNEREWIDACKGGPPGSSSFEYASRLTEMVLLGNVAVRAGLHQAENGHPVMLNWDPAAMRVTNLPEANQYLRNEYRKGWEL